MKKILKAFQNIVAIFKINFIDFRFLFFINRVPWIFSRSLLISCASYNGVFN